MGFSTRLLLVLPLAVGAGRAGAQSIGLGTPTPHASAMLDVSSTTQGLLLPRLTQAQLAAIGGPSVGLLAYNTTTNQLNQWNGTGWQALLSVAPVATLPAQTYTAPQAYTYTVPAGVYALDATLRGASGSAGLPSWPLGRGGGGATVRARLLVVPGQALEVRVGGQGDYYSSSSGGYNGGGNSSYAGGGGGGTDIRLPGSGYPGRLLVAGGGGGTQSGNSGYYAGGSGGYPAGSDGEGGPQDGGAGTWAGRGGSQSSGGAGGTTGSSVGAPGGSGGLGDGGSAVGGYSGGGGGGYYGGGAGAHINPGNAPGYAQVYGGGTGGGGSSYAGPGTRLAVFQSGSPTVSRYHGQATLQPVVAVAAPALDARNFTNLPLPWQRSGSSLAPTSWLDNVGIGTSSPAYPLDVAGSTRVLNGWLEVRHDAASAYLWFHHPGQAFCSVGMDRADGNNFKIREGNDLGNSSFRTYLTIRKSNGGVGIGTTAPAAPLHIALRTSIGPYAFAYFKANYNRTLPGIDFWEAIFWYADNYDATDVTIKAEGRFVVGELNAVSDRRLKQVIGLSDRTADLALLRRLRVTDYQLLDRARYGTQPFKKVIAQDVEEIFPQAVTRKTDFLPDIYAAARRAEALPGDSLLRLTLPTAPAGGLRPGQRLRLLGPAGEATATVVRAAGPVLTLRGAGPLAGQPVFVFGREHADVRAVDYEALSMLNISATQALDAQLRTLRAHQAQALGRTAQATQAAQQATAAAASATATVQAFEQRLAAAEARLGRP